MNFNFETRFLTIYIGTFC